MKFEEVLTALREGKRVRRTFWSPSHYIELNGTLFYDNATSKDYNFTLNDFTCNNWEIVKRKRKVKLRDLIKEQFNSCCSKYSDEFLDQEIEVEEDD